MVRRVNFFPSRWFVLTALSAFGLCASLPGQSDVSLHPLTPSTSRFVVPSSFALSSAATSAAAGDLNGDGRPDLVVTEKGSGSVTVLMSNAKGGFAAGVAYPAGTLAGNVQLADLNHDGRLDLIVTDSANGAIDVLFGNGDGSFGKAVAYPAIANPVALTVGNIAGKGKIDLAVAGSAGVAVLLNDGSGHFAAPASLALSSAPLSLASADFRGADHDDLALANQDGTITLLIGDGTGAFHPQPAISAASGSISGIVSGDFNGDGHADLAVSASGANSVLVLLGRGDGSFAPGVSYAVGNGPATLIAADLSGSGATDLISVNQGANTFTVLHGNGDGTFVSAGDFVSGKSPLALAAGDFNADGRADLVIANSGDATVSVPFGRGDSTFLAPRAYRTDLLARAIAAGDLNGDGRPDLVVANYCGADSSCSGNGTATVFLANLDGSYRAASTISLGNGPMAVALADLHGTGKLDLVAANRNDKTLVVLQGNGDGTFGKAQSYSLNANPRALLVADLNGDKTPDVIVASDCGQDVCSQPGNVDIFLGGKNGYLTAFSSNTVGFGPVSIAAADLRSSGHLDLVVANSCGDDASCKSAGTASILSGDGAGKFTLSNEIGIGNSPSAIAIGNLSGNGLDLAVAQRGSNQLAVFHSDGSGSFGAAVTYAVGQAPSSLTIGDFNGDGHADVAVSNFQSATVSILYSAGNGALRPAVSYPVAAGPEAVLAVSKISGSTPGIVTANGDSGSSPIGNRITSLDGSDPGTGTTTVTLTPGTGSSTVDASVTLNGAVAGVSPAGTPTGSVIFAIDNGGGNFTSITDCAGAPGSAQVALDPSGDATCTTEQLPHGNPTSVQLQYLGDPTYAVNQSDDSTFTVAHSGTATAVPTGSAGTVDQALTVTATVSPSGSFVSGDLVAFASDDTVTFLNGATAIAACSNVTTTATADGITATCQVTGLAAGNHSIGAQFNNATDETNYTASSTSSGTSFTVNAADTAVTVNSASPSSPTVDQQITLSATVAPAAGTAVVPFGGSIKFLLGGTAISGCTASPVNGTTGVASCTISAGLAKGSYSITAQYNSGDTNYNASAVSTSFPLSVAVAPTTASISPTSLSTSVDGSVTFTATVSPHVTTSAVSTANVTSIGGQVSFSVGGTAISGCTTQDVTFNSATGTGTATCTTTSLHASGSAQSVTATYLGDANYAASAASNPASSVTVSKATTTTSVSANPSSPALNAPVTFTALVTFPTPLTVAPTGTDTVTFSDNGANITDCGTGNTTITVTATANIYQATCQIGSLSGGSHAILAQYNGDSNFSSSTGNLSIAIGQGSSTTTVTSSLNPSTANAAVSFTVNVAGGTTVAVTGSATVKDGAATVGQCTLSGWTSSTPATCTVPGSSLSVGQHNITASYSGNSSYNSSSTASALVQTVNKAATNLTVTSSSTNNTSTINSSVTFTAQITLPAGTITPTGTVAFTDPASICSPQGLTLSGTSAGTATYTATCSTSSLAIGTYTITATYAGDSSFLTSNGTTSQTVNTANSTTGITGQPPSAVDSTVTFQATVSAPSGNQTPTGLMTFTDTVNGATANLCTNVSLTSGVYVCTTNALIAGTHTITANYPGDANFQKSSASTSQVITKAASSLTLTGSNNTITANSVATLTFTAAVVPSSGPIFASGNIVFTDTSGTAQTTLCTSAVSGAGVATCTPTTLPAGSNSIQASYAGDANFTAVAAGAGPTFTVAVQDFGMTLSGPPSVNGVSTVSVTQGATSSNDRFSPVTFTVTPTTISGYTGSVSLTCSSAATGAPKCTPPASLSVASGGTQTGGSIVIDATNASPGNYTFTLTGTDTTTNLAHSTTFTVIVRSLATPLAIVSGATTGNTANISFVLPAGVSLSSLQCLDVVGTGITTQNVPPSAISVSCSFNPTTIPSSNSLQTGKTAVTVSTSGTTTASLDRNPGLLVAGLFGLPLFGLLGFRRGRKSASAILFRLVAIVALTAAAYQVMGCGGSFQRPPVTSGKTPAGQYYVLIQGTATPGNATYQAVLELDVSL